MASDEASISVTPCRGFTCVVCSSPLIQPLEWDPATGDGWNVLVRCPECFQVGALHLTTDQAHQFQNSLDEAARGLEETADMLDLQVFKATCEDFTRSLRDDRVNPTDF